jgi:hypothetical protein
VNKFELNWVALLMVFALLVTGIIGLELATRGADYASAHGSLFFVLVFWTGVVQGCIALVAVADSLKAKWVDPVRRHMLAVHPMLLLLPILFAVCMVFELKALPWTEGGPVHHEAHEGGGAWFGERFFMIRNFVLLSLVYFVGAKFSKESARLSEKRSAWAIRYLFLYVLCQSMVAFDWVMPLDYPWPSAMLGGFFFLEGGYAALAVCGIIGFLVWRKSKEEFEKGRAGFRDLGGFRLAFSLGWGWFFFSQYLVIWYGNLPEEVSWFVDRAHGEHGNVLYPLLWIIVVFILFFPFLAQIPERSKSDPRIFGVISVVMLSTLLLERIVMIAPRITLHPMIIIVEFGIMIVIFLLSMGSRERILERPYAVSN